MSTKAELETELAELRKKLADAADAIKESEVGRAPSALADMLRAQGVSPEEIAALWKKLSGEIGNLPRDRPLAMAIGAFGFGFLLGRASKS